MQKVRRDRVSVTPRRSGKNLAIYVTTSIGGKHKTKIVTVRPR